MSARTRLLVVSEPEERLLPLPRTASWLLEYGDERTAGEDAVRRREGIVVELSAVEGADRLTQCQMVEKCGGGGHKEIQISPLLLYIILRVKDRDRLFDLRTFLPPNCPLRPGVLPTPAAVTQPADPLQNVCDSGDDHQRAHRSCSCARRSGAIAGPGLRPSSGSGIKAARKIQVRNLTCASQTIVNLKSLYLRQG